MLHPKRVLGLRAVRLADDAGREIFLDDGLGQRLKGRPVGHVIEGQMALFACIGVFNLGKMAMERTGNTISAALGNAVKHAAIAVGVGKSTTNLAAIQMPEVHHGDETGTDAALLDDLVQRAKLIELAHGLDTKANGSSH